MNTDDFNYINEPSKPNIKNFIELLKRNNIDTKNVLWQNTKLTPKQLEENKEHIRDFNIENINSGYLCSICDPFLLLIACIFKVNIEHSYNNVKIDYTHEGEYRKKSLKFSSDTGHFWKS